MLSDGHNNNNKKRFTFKLKKGCSFVRYLFIQKFPDYILKSSKHI